MPTVTVPHQTRARSWARIPKRPSQAKMRLFCFPYAGGRSQVFRDWIATGSNTIEICPVLLPGETIAEDSASSVDELIPLLAKGLQPHLDVPFAFFGHSMGAVIAFELLRFLQRNSGARAEHLFVSARIAPSLLDRTKPLHRLPQEEFISELKVLDGTPPEILESADLIELLLPRLRADFCLIETYRYAGEDDLSCPITAFCGTDDPHVQPEEMIEWRKHTTGAFSLHLIPGDHFFVHSRRSDLLQNIESSLASPQS